MLVRLYFEPPGVDWLFLYLYLARAASPTMDNGYIIIVILIHEVRHVCFPLHLTCSFSHVAIWYKTNCNWIGWGKFSIVPASPPLSNRCCRRQNAASGLIWAPFHPELYVQDLGGERGRGRQKLLPDFRCIFRLVCHLSRGCGCNGNIAAEPNKPILLTLFLVIINLGSLHSQDKWTYLAENVWLYRR